MGELGAGGCYNVQQGREGTEEFITGGGGDVVSSGKDGNLHCSLVDEGDNLGYRPGIQAEFKVEKLGRVLQYFA